MKLGLKSISLLLAISILLASCSSTTMISSNPPGAKLYLDGELVGETPYRHTDSKIVGTTTAIKIEKEGYKPLIADMTRNEEADIGAIIGGLLIWVPFLWTLKYKPTHKYELMPLGADNNNSSQISVNPTDKAQQLRELKKLLDEKIITEEEFNKEKAKILNQQ